MGRRLGSLVVVVIAGLILGAIVHIAAIFAIPQLATRNAYARFGRPPDETAVLFPGAAGAPSLPQPDPAVAVSACTFDVSKGPVVARATTISGFASFAVYGRGGQVLYAVTDQAAVRGQMTLTLMTQAYYDEHVADTDEANAEVLRFVTPVEKGLVVMRVLAGFPSQMATAKRAAGSLRCLQQSPGGPAP